MSKVIYEILEGAGLSGREVKIYLKLLSLGETTPGELIKETKMYRADIYEVIKKLIEKGLVSHIKSKGKLFYKPADPKRLLDIMDDKKAEIEQRKADISTILKQLEDKYGSKKVKRDVSVLEGIEGLKTILVDAENEGKPIYLLGGNIRFFDIMAHRFPQWEKRRIERSVEMTGIWIDNPEIRTWVKDRALINARFIPKEQMSPFVQWASCGDILAMFTFEENPLIVKIRSKELSEAFRKYFDLMWKIAKE